MITGERYASRYEFSKVSANFESDGVECAGWLYRPDRPANPPIIVMAPGLAGERTFGLPAYAERLAARGYAVFSFDYRGFGDSEGEPRQRIAIRKQLQDYEAAIARVHRLDDIDTSRLVLWGVSLSGGHVLRLAALDHRVDAVIAQSPMVDGKAVAKARMRDPKYALKALTAGLRDKLGSYLGRTHEVPVVGSPEEFAILNDPGVEESYLDLVPLRSDWQNRVPAEILLSLPGYRPIEAADEIQCPALLLAGSQDRLIPASSITAMAGRIPDSTLVTMPIDHFDVFEDGLEQALAHQLAFLDTVVR